MWWRLRLARTESSFRREHPIGPYRADFACIELGLVIELDGGQHMTCAAQAHDARRDAFLRSSGWTVLRVWTRQWFENPDGVVLAIDEALTFARLEREQAFDGSCGRTPLNRLRLSASSQNSKFAASPLVGRLREAVVGCSSGRKV
jgi:very-short-patch-repair endonuclease